MIFGLRSGFAAVVAASIALRDHRLSEIANIEKVGDLLSQFVPGCNLTFPFGKGHRSF